MPHAPSVQVTKITYSSPAGLAADGTLVGGAMITLGATVKGGSYTDFNWIQTVTTSDPPEGKPANKPYIDNEGRKSPFYLYGDDKTRLDGLAKKLGKSSVFEDRPLRAFHGTPITWHADLKLVGINKNGTYTRLAQVSYGFTLDAKGVHLENLKGAQ